MQRAFLAVHALAGQACHNVAAFTALACKLRQQLAQCAEGFALQCFIIIVANLHVPCTLCAWVTL